MHTVVFAIKQKNLDHLHELLMSTSDPAGRQFWQAEGEQVLLQ
jgi:hypothetical protein